MVLGKQENNLSQKAVCIIESHGNMLLTKKVETRTQKNTYDGVFVKKVNSFQPAVNCFC